MKPVLTALALLLAPHLQVRSLTDDDLAKVQWEQKLGGHMPLAVLVTDDSGTQAPLAACFTGRPVLFAFAYYDCPSLCTLVLNGLLDAVKDLRADAGREFEIVVVSIRAGQSSAIAAAKKETYVTRYGRPGTAKGWHFLVADEKAVHQLADAAGFHFTYDPSRRQFAHPSGILVLTPEGRISKYLLGIEFPPGAVHQALVEASEKKIGPLAQRLLLLCFHYNPATSRYGLLISRIIQAAGGVTVLLLGLLVVRLNHHPRAKNP